ncbi:MAG: lamin tail domain-containing protein, partial [Candidatus Nanopelagicales bacterium]
MHPPVISRPLVAVAALALGLAPLVLATPAVAAEAPPIVINEVESNQDATDWIELMNVGDADVDVSGWILKDDNDGRTLAIAAGAVIPPGGLLAVDTDDSAVPGSFGLGANDMIRVYLPDGATLVAQYAWTSHAATTYGRCPDRTGDFIVTLAGTKGAPNACAPDPAEAIVVNEVVSSGGVPGDWVELKNTTTAPVDAGGLVLTDSNPANRYTIPGGTVVPAGGYLVLDELRSGVGHFDFGLGGTDSAVLYAADGTTVIDRFDWTAHGAPSWGRCADGVGAFAATVSVTKGAANDCAPSAAAGAIVVNEVESNGDLTDWVEVMNIGDVAIDLSGYGFRDNDPTRPLYLLPAGSVVQPGGLLVIDQAVGAGGGFDFGLGNADEVHLFEPDGVTEVASWSWTTHASVTYGRCPDGTGDFIDTITSTKGAPNVCGIPVRINEVESSGGAPGDWVELKNLATTAVDVSGLVLTDSNPANAFAIPSGTTIPAGGYHVLDEVEGGVGDFGFGLGAADAVRLLDGASVVDEVGWTSHAAVTYGRCPDGTG